MWSRGAGPAVAWPESRGFISPRTFYGVLAATLVFRFWFAATLPITGDEAYFFYWGVIPDWGYYDHPPMVGWWLAALHAVSDATWWVRLPSVLQPAVISCVMWRVLRGQGEAVALAGALLVLLAPANVWNVAITTDTPLVYFSFFSALCFLRAARDDDARWYFAAGLLLGGAFLSKYFSGLLGLAYAAFALWRPTRRKIAGLVLVVLGCLPAVALNVWWNMGHCWANIMFNLYNRHEGAGLSWKTPLLYLATLAYLLTPFLSWRLLRAGSWSWGSLPSALPALVLVPLGLFAVLSLVKTIGMHWLLSFVPFVLMAFVLAADEVSRARMVRFFAGFAVLHVLAIAVIASLPVETWRGSRIYDGVVLTVKTDEVLQALAPYERDYVMTTEGYSFAVTLSFNAKRYFPVFGPGSSHARHDDILTDFRAFDGRNILVLAKDARDSSRFTPYFRKVDIKPLEVRGAKYWIVLGQGFDFAAYRETVLESVRERWYAIPRFLPMNGCYFCDRYFPERQCRATR